MPLQAGACERGEPCKNSRCPYRPVPANGVSPAANKETDVPVCDDNPVHGRGTRIEARVAKGASPHSGRTGMHANKETVVPICDDNPVHGRGTRIEARLAKGASPHAGRSGMHANCVEHALQLGA